MVDDFVLVGRVVSPGLPVVVVVLLLPGLPVTVDMVVDARPVVDEVLVVDVLELVVSPSVLVTVTDEVGPGTSSVIVRVLVRTCEIVMVKERLSAVWVVTTVCVVVKVPADCVCDVVVDWACTGSAADAEARPSVGIPTSVEDEAVGSVAWAWCSTLVCLLLRSVRYS